MKTHLRNLSSYYFLIPLTLLILNDFYLKAALNNWFTGKLSDFAGLFVFGVFWCTLLPKWRKVILWTIAFSFIIWKSIYSQGLINIWNSLEIMTITRVVDYTDLWALIVLPFSGFISISRKSFKRVKLTPVIPLMLALFAFVATSSPAEVTSLNKEYVIDANRIKVVALLQEEPFDENSYYVYPDDVNKSNFSISLVSASCDIVGFQIKLTEKVKGQTIIQVINYTSDCKQSKEEIVDQINTLFISDIRKRVSE